MMTTKQIVDMLIRHYTNMVAHEEIRWTRMCSLLVSDIEEQCGDDGLKTLAYNAHGMRVIETAFDGTDRDLSSYRRLHNMRLLQSSVGIVIDDSDDDFTAYVFYASHKWDTFNDPNIYSVYVNRTKTGNWRCTVSYHGDRPAVRQEHVSAKVAIQFAKTFLLQYSGSSTLRRTINED